MNITYIPVLNADIVTGISLMLLFVFANMRLGLLTMLLAHITLTFLCDSIGAAKLKQLDKSSLRGSFDLGATPWYAFKR